MESINVLHVARLPESEREAQMTAIIGQLLHVNEREQRETLTEMVRTMGENATDGEYLNLCHTTLKLAADLPPSTLKTFLGVRMGAQHDLPAVLAERDQSMIQQSLQSAPETVRNTIVAAL